MQNLVRGSSGPGGLRKSPQPPLDEKGTASADETGGAGGDGAGVGGTVKLNANANEFVPRSKIDEDDLQAADRQYPNVNAQEFVPRLQKEAMTQVNADSDEELEALEEPLSNENLILPWRGFPKRPIKVGHISQVVLINDKEYMIVPCQKSARKPHEGTPPETAEEAASPNDLPSNDPNGEEKRLVPEKKRFAAEEKRREQERKVALEALKLVEQRRARGPLVPNMQSDDSSEPPRQIMHLSRSPVRYTPKERIRVDALRSAKKERIEKILHEMSLERVTAQEKVQQRKDALTTTTPSSSPQKPKPTLKAAKRYIPTVKEWDEQRRAKLQARREAKKAPIQTQQIPAEVEVQVAKRPDVPRYLPPGQCLPGERRKGNLTHWKRFPVWTLQVPQKQLRSTDPGGQPILRYTIEELLQLEPQPEDLDRPDFDDRALRLGFLCT